MKKNAKDVDTEPGDPRYTMPSAVDQLFTRARLQYDRGHKTIAACLLLDGPGDEPPAEDLPEREPDAEREAHRIDQAIAVDVRGMIRDAVKRDRYAKNKDIALALGCTVKEVIAVKQLMEKHKGNLSPKLRAAR